MARSSARGAGTSPEVEVLGLAAALEAASSHPLAQATIAAADAVAALHSEGIATVMLTGDNALTARAIATQAGIDQVQAEQLPADKAEHIRRLAGQAPTAMIGDGINDAPALASSTVGIAMGMTGSAAAVESADVAFTGNDLRLIADAVAHARQGRAIMTGNIALALAIIVILFPLALVGMLGLAAVVRVHEIAEVVVILNGIRAARARRRPTQTVSDSVARVPAAVMRGGSRRRCGRRGRVAGRGRRRGGGPRRRAC
jgi:cation-transporting ATPase G